MATFTHWQQKPALGGENQQDLPLILLYRFFPPLGCASGPGRHLKNNASC
jgi:hypothetical protein